MVNRPKRLARGESRPELRAMETLTEFIARRYRELDAAEEPLRRQIEAIRQERDQMRRAALAAGIAIDATAAEGAPAVEAERVPARRRQASATLKEAVVEILRREGRGMTALQILPLVNEFLGHEYPRTSLSPQLSRLKVEGVIDRNGVIWTLVEPASETNEAADDVSEQETSAASDHQPNTPVKPGEEVEHDNSVAGALFE